MSSKAEFKAAILLGKLAPVIKAPYVAITRPPMVNTCRCCDYPCHAQVKPSWLIMQHALRQDLTYHRIMWAVKYNDNVLRIGEEDDQ